MQNIYKIKETSKAHDDNHSLLGCALCTFVINDDHLTSGYSHLNTRRGQNMNSHQTQRVSEIRMF
jgi:hypothetical protein